MSETVTAEFADVTGSGNPTAEQLSALEAGPEGAPDGFESEGGDAA